MRSLSRTAACCAALALTFFGASVSTFVGFGGAVLVGDGEIFVGEAANNFRPGTVYVYRRGGSAWQEAASLTAPNGAVGDQFGSALALDGTRLFVKPGNNPEVPLNARTETRFQDPRGPIFEFQLDAQRRVTAAILEQGPQGANKTRLERK